MAALTPLTGRRLVTLALNVPGPMAAQRLQQLGAAVIKVEPPDGDPLKVLSPDWYAELTKDISVEICDLKTAAGQRRIRELLATADLLLTSQRPAALTRLMLNWTELHARFPTLCHVAIVGHAAPDQNKPGHDLTYFATNDLLQPPALPATLYADITGSEQAALAALTLLLQRARTGTGHYLEVALADAAARLAAPRRAGLTLGGAILGGGFPGYNLYRTQDGWLAVATLERRFYDRLLEHLGIPEPSYDRLAERFRTQTGAYWKHFAVEHDLPMTVVQS
jgi:alpha-methylacyl-CoA racemase